MTNEWDDNWEHYQEANFFGRYRLNSLVKKIVSSVPLPCNMIDIGIGPGDLSYLLKQEGYAQFGVDTSKKAVKICSDKGLNVEIGDAFGINTVDESYDMSLSDGLLEHFKDRKDIVLLLKEHIRVSKKYVVISLPSTSFTNTLYRLLKPYDVDEYRIPYVVFKSILKDFDNVKIIKSGHYNLRLSYYFILEKTSNE